MAPRSYAQQCGLADALDLLGERWTLLVIRELLVGPRRFTDLLDGLPGIGTALLTRRVRDLEDAGLLERVRLQRPATGTAYSLTEDGRALDGIVLALARWGSVHGSSEDGPRTFRPRWALLGLRARFDPAAARGLDATYELRVDGEAYEIVIDDGELEVREGPARRPDVIVETDAATLALLAADPAAAADALAEGRLSVPLGAASDLARFGSLFPTPVLTKG